MTDNAGGAVARQELLLCPFCGHHADYIGSPGKGYRVECKRCLAQSGWGDYGYQVEAQWNKRAIPDADRARIRELEAALREIQKATVEGRVCNDTAWFDSITTLHDYCGIVLDDGAPAYSPRDDEASGYTQYTRYQP